MIYQGMLDLYHRSHLQHGFIQPDGDVRGDFVADGIFYVEFGKVERQPADPFSEAQRAARLIADSNPGEIWICMSGGVDSEAVARAFLAAGVPFHAAILRFSHGLNDFDICHAVRFCEEHGVPTRFFELDIDEFYLGGRHFEIAERYRCISPQLTAHIELLERVPGVPVLSWNPVFPFRRADGRVSLGMPKDLYFSYNRYFLENKKRGVPHFFLYTPELAYSFFACPSFRAFLKSAHQTGGFTYEMKCDLYREGGFAIENREDKFTGFEKVKIHFSEMFNEDQTVFDRRFRFPLREKYPEHSRLIFNIVPDYLQTEIQGGAS